MDDFHSQKNILMNYAQMSDFQSVSNKSFRSVSLNQTIKKILKLKTHFGITRISEITELDHIGLPVISVIRPSVNSAQITATQGKGLSVKIALASGLMEAVERTAAANFKNIITSSTINLLQSRQTVLTPYMLGGYLDDHVNCEWVQAQDLYSQRKLWVPAADVIFPFYPMKDSVRPFRPSTTGIASGNTFLEALLSSINEVVERYATSNFLKNFDAHVLDQTSIKCKVVQTILSKFHTAHIDVLIFDLSQYAALPVYYVSVLSQDARGLDIACAGQSAHLIPEVALRRALLEAAQSRAVAIQGSREDLIRHASDWQGSFDYFKQQRQQLKNHIIALHGFSQMQQPSSHSYISTYDLVCATLEQLYQQSYKNIIISDLTENGIGIPVTHVIIPGMIDTIIEAKRQSHQVALIESILLEG